MSNFKCFIFEFPIAKKLKFIKNDGFRQMFLHLLSFHDIKETKILVQKYMFYYYNITRDVFSFIDYNYFTHYFIENILPVDFYKDLFDFNKSSLNIPKLTIIVTYKHIEENIEINICSININKNIIIKKNLCERIYSLYEWLDFNDIFNKEYSFKLYEDELNYLTNSNIFLFPIQYNEFEKLYNSTDEQKYIEKIILNNPENFFFEKENYNFLFDKKKTIFINQLQMGFGKTKIITHLLIYHNFVERKFDTCFIITKSNLINQTIEIIDDLKNYSKNIDISYFTLLEINKNNEKYFKMILTNIDYLINKTKVIFIVEYHFMHYLFIDSIGNEYFNLSNINDVKDINNVKNILRVKDFFTKIREIIKNKKNCFIYDESDDI